MKRTLLLTIALTLFSVFAAHSEEKVLLFDAFKNADANAISTYFNDNIEMTLPNAQNFFSKSQARIYRVSFFARKVPNAAKKQIYLLRIEKSLESEK